MKIPSAKKLASGNWRVQLMIDGRRVSITGKTKQEAEHQAAAVKSGAEKLHRPASSMTVGQAMDQYIEFRASVYSPSSVMGFKKLRRNTLKLIMNTPLCNLTPNDVQRAVNQMSLEGKAPKYISSAHSLLRTVLESYAPDFVLETKLPAKQKKEIVIPTEEDVQKMLSAAKGTSAELSINLAVWLGLRASEISGLTWDCIEGDYLHIKQARVRGDDGLFMKAPKSYSGDRTIHIPPVIQTLLQQQPHNSEYIVNASPHAIYSRYSRLCEKNGITHYRFHDLRHYNVSIMLANGTPMNYIIERVGHSSEDMVRRVYGHIMQFRKNDAADALEAYMAQKLHT